MLEKEKLALVRVLFRRNSVPQFCAMLPQVTPSLPFTCALTHALTLSISFLFFIFRLKRQRRAGGASLRGSTSSCSHLRMTSALRRSRGEYEVDSTLLFVFGCMRVADVHTPASDDVKNAAREWIDKLGVKTGAFPPDSYPNPGTGSSSLFVVLPSSDAVHSARFPQCTASGECVPGGI